MHFSYREAPVTQPRFTTSWDINERMEYRAGSDTRQKIMTIEFRGRYTYVDQLDDGDIFSADGTDQYIWRLCKPSREWTKIRKEMSPQVEDSFDLAQHYRKHFITCVESGVFQPNKEYIEFWDERGLVVKDIPLHIGRKEPEKMTYIERIASALRIELYHLSVRRDGGADCVDQHLIEMCKKYAGENFHTEASRAQAKAILDSFSGALTRVMERAIQIDNRDNLTRQASELTTQATQIKAQGLSRLLEAIALRVARYDVDVMEVDSVQGVDSAQAMQEPRESRYVADAIDAFRQSLRTPAYTEVAVRNLTNAYFSRTGEVMQHVLAVVTERLDNATLLRYFTLNSVCGSVRRAARSSRPNAIHNAINRLRLLDYSDELSIRDQLNDNGYIECADCGAWEAANNARTPYNQENDVCPACLNARYVYSNHYDDHIPQHSAIRALDQDGDTVYVLEGDDAFIYNDAIESWIHRDYRPSSNILRRYHSAKNNDMFRLIDSPFTLATKRYFGIELEVELRDSSDYHDDDDDDDEDDYDDDDDDNPRPPRDIQDVVVKLNDALNGGIVGKKVWFEEDGSLTHGFEMISNPMGLDAHTDFWKWLNDPKLTQGLRSHDTSTCGLHIHISKKPLTVMQIDKMNVFINHPDNADLINKISRRYATNYARIRAKKLGFAHHTEDRYEAFNTTNRHTVELRIFKGTIKYTSFMAALEFANALVNFTAPASPAGFRLDTQTFMRFIEMPAYRDETKHLREYLASSEAKELTEEQKQRVSQEAKRLQQEEAERAMQRQARLERVARSVREVAVGTVEELMGSVLNNAYAEQSRTNAERLQESMRDTARAFSDYVIRSTPRTAGTATLGTTTTTSTLGTTTTTSTLGTTTGTTNTPVYDPYTYMTTYR